MTAACILREAVIVQTVPNADVESSRWRMLTGFFFWESKLLFSANVTVGPICYSYKYQCHCVQSMSRPAVSLSCHCFDPSAAGLNKDNSCLTRIPVQKVECYLGCRHSEVEASYSHTVSVYIGDVDFTGDAFSFTKSRRRRQHPFFLSNADVRRKKKTTTS